MNLYILRHGIAVEPDVPARRQDAERPLTAKGKKRLRQIAGAMKAMELSFDLILFSPYLRALQTAEIVAEIFPRRRKFAVANELTPGGNPKTFIEQLNKIKPAPKNVLLVGHEPYLGQFIGLLAAGNTNMAIDFKKGGLCKLEVETLRYGRCATLAWLLAPRQMALMI
jgi:phosphohistidine phosphatase